MKRSEVNRIIEEARRFLRARRFELPPFAYWTPADWRAKGAESAAIVKRRLGWDITDFGSGAFDRNGLFLFTLRNGDVADLGTGRGMLYGEKVLIVDVDQVTPLHRHVVKTEDIINRGGGKLAVRLYNATRTGDVDRSDVVVMTDGVVRTVAAGATLLLEPGQSVTLPSGLYHEFWGVDETVLVGEVSLVNDDAADNFFYEDVGRFPTIEEDDEPLHLLVNDYDRFTSVDA